MKMKTFIFQCIAVFLIFSTNYGFCSDKKESDQGNLSSGSKIETTRSGNQETTTYTSVSKDYMSGGKCTETKERK